MKFTMTIEGEGAALTDDTAYEVERLLVLVTELVRTDFTSGPLYDSNGNVVGSWELTA